MMQFWKKTRRVFIIKLTIITLVLALLGRGVFWLCCPEYYFAGFPLVPLFFYIYGLIYIFLFEFFGSHNVKQLIWVYLGSKCMKLLLSVLFLLLYGLLCEEPVARCFLTFILYYIGFLVFETEFFVRFEQIYQRKFEE